MEEARQPFVFLNYKKNLKTSHIIKQIVNSHLVSGHRLIYRSGHMLTFFLNHTAKYGSISLFSNNTSSQIETLEFRKDDSDS